ncbi:hypothetical protein ANTQUA_LOCUS2298 [Anthophora quadrimaculata]
MVEISDCSGTQSHEQLHTSKHTTTVKPIVWYVSLFGQFTSSCTPRILITNPFGYRFHVIRKNRPKRLSAIYSENLELPCENSR